MCYKFFFKFTFLILFFSEVLFAQYESEEWIKVYFNMPSGDEYTIGNHNWDLIGTLEQLIDSATSSIDLCIYDLEHPRIGEALVRAKKRGLRVRIITDSNNRTDGGELDLKMWNLLSEAHIISIDDDGDIYYPNNKIEDNRLVNAGADMHNKFAIIDVLSNSPNDDIVWTGSTNLTYTGSFNTNNVIVIKDADVANVYLQEFDQMWGGNGEIPNPNKAVFHKDKKDVSEHLFDVGGTKIEIYFSPINRDRSKPSISDRLIDLIEKEAQTDIKFQAFSITPSIPLSEAIWQATDSGVINLQGVIDPSFYSRYRKTKEIWGSEEARTNNRSILAAKETRKLHHKILILDAENSDSTDIGVVVTGSYNFSNNAEVNNDENIVIIYSDEITQQYAADFSGVMSRAKGETEAPAPPINSDTWYSVYSIKDGGYFQIEVLPGFGYPVRMLGVDVPSLYAGEDSAYYFSGPSAEYLRNMLEGRKVRLSGFDGGIPESRYGSFRAYIQVEYDETILSLNQVMLKNGYGTYSKYYRQQSDSINAFKLYEEQARVSKEGLWKTPNKIGTIEPLLKEASKGDALLLVFPININTADQATLQLLPGIGVSYAKRIIDYRIEHGGFSKIEELMEIKGIGEKRFEKIRPLVTL